MSIRLRLTLLYSAILALTLIVLGIAIYAAVSHVSLGAAGSALSAETRSVVGALQPHLGPPPNGAPQDHGMGGQGSQDGGGTAGTQGENPLHNQYNGGGFPSGGDQLGDLGTFVPPPDVATQHAIQIRALSGTVLYQSSDLQAAKVTLPLSAAARRQLRPGTTPQSTVTVGTQRLLLANVLLTFHGTPVGILQVAQSLHDVDQTLASLRQIMLIGGLIATLAACVAGWWLAGTALRPINRITQTAEEIGATQDFARRLSYAGPPDEVGRLAATFNTMLASLQSAYHTQRRFVADASHELRTPLTSIRGNLGLLERQPPIADADRLAVVADLVSESERLSRLVSDLLTLARSDTGRPLRQEAVPISPLIGDVIRRMAVLHPDRVIHEGAHHELTACGDADAITQVLVILLDNALKFTPADGTVTVSTAPHGDRVLISVRDSGPGVAPEALPHIFERFYQGNAARTGTGTGLGLSIAKALVEGMHGTIEAQSELGHGSCFSVTLPSAPQAAS